MNFNNLATAFNEWSARAAATRNQLESFKRLGLRPRDCWYATEKGGASLARYAMNMGMKTRDGGMSYE